SNLIHVSEALGLRSLRGHVVVVDEAHNLPDALAGLCAAQLSGAQLARALAQLTRYARRFQRRLAGRNRVYVTQVIRLVQSLLAFVEEKKTRHDACHDGTCEPAEMLRGKGVDQINLHKLSRYLQESKLARKVDGYVEHDEARRAQGRPRGGAEAGTTTTTTTTTTAAAPVLFQVHAFLLPLMNPSKEGRLFYERTPDGDVLLKYMLLDPTNHFREIVEEARAVILAGGTMSPMSDWRDHLLSYLPPHRLRTFSFGHVIPRENLLAAVLPRGALGSRFEFTFDKRGAERLVVDLGVTLARLCRHVPDGVVVFFPSYEYLNRVLAVWKRCPPPSQSGQLGDGDGRHATVFAMLEACKPVFHEVQSGSQSQSQSQARPDGPDDLDGNGPLNDNGRGNDDLVASLKVRDAVRRG
ncbi:ATP-dependent DNA helicase chl1, partial [Ascosphaera acerosa]